VAQARPAGRSVPDSTADGAPTVRLAYPLVADLMRPSPACYYADLALSAGLGWTALLAGAALFPSPWAAPALVAAVLALYRATSFIHELTHLRPGAVPGLDAAWNVAVGIPLLLPSMLYAGGVHAVHHAKAHYGTSRDPEYLPIGRWPRWKQSLWVLHAGALPLALVLRFLVLAPASTLHRPVRRWVWGRASSLSVNPAFVRSPPPPELRARFLLQEVACSAWAFALAALVARGVGVRYVAAAAAVAATVGVLNQLRTLVAHRFLNAGDAALSFEEQFLDSVNVPGQALLTPLWAPVGLRYHGLHHLLPGLPYHALGAAHRRLLGSLPAGAAYHRVNERGLRAALRAMPRDQKPSKFTGHTPVVMPRKR
jgi:fatty acid desaturase